MLINANGIIRHMKCHITRDHSGLQREVHIRVETRYGRIRRHTVPRIVARTLRKRYGVAQSGKGSTREESQVPDNNQAVSRDRSSEPSKHDSTNAALSKIGNNARTQEEIIASLDSESDEKRNAEMTEKTGKQKANQQPENNHATETHMESQGNPANITGASYCQTEEETPQDALPIHTQEKAESGSESEPDSARRRRKHRLLQSRQTGRAACYRESVSLTDLTQSTAPNDPTQDAEEEEGE